MSVTNDLHRLTGSFMLQKYCVSRYFCDRNPCNQVFLAQKYTKESKLNFRRQNINLCSERLQLYFQNLLTIFDDEFKLFPALRVSGAFHIHTRAVRGIVMDTYLRIAVWAYYPHLLQLWLRNHFRPPPKIAPAAATFSSWVMLTGIA